MKRLSVLSFEKVRQRLGVRQPSGAFRVGENNPKDLDGQRNLKLGAHS
jgi:hypothetical protein